MALYNSSSCQRHEVIVKCQLLSVCWVSFFFFFPPINTDQCGSSHFSIFCTPAYWWVGVFCLLTLCFHSTISTANLCIREAMVTDILLGKNDNVEGVCTFFGMNFYAPSVVLTTGTFMSGKIWVGRTSMPAGRAGESASHGLTENLQRLGFETDRLKTGTPSRVDLRTVDFSGLEPQHGDEEVFPFYPLCRLSDINSAWFMI